VVITEKGSQKMEQKFSNQFKHVNKGDIKNLKHLYPDKEDNSSLFGSASPAKESVLDIMYTMMHEDRNDGFNINGYMGGEDNMG
jgi:hypothetical protein